MKETRIIIKDFETKGPGYYYRICDYDRVNYLIEVRRRPIGFDTVTYRETDETDMDADPEITDKSVWQQFDGLNMSLAIGKVVRQIVGDN